MKNTINKKSKNKDIYLNAIENLGYAIEGLSSNLEDLARMTATQSENHGNRLDKIEAELKTKATKSDILKLQDELANKADKSDILKLREELANKADKSDILKLQNELATKANKSDILEFKKELKTSATKSDILNLQDKLVSKSNFDKLSIRVLKVENKIKK